MVAAAGAEGPVFGSSFLEHPEMKKPLQRYDGFHLTLRGEATQPKLGWERLVCYDWEYHVRKGKTGMIRVRMPQKKKELEIPGPKRVMDILAAAGVRPIISVVSGG
jgi:hypothetical protein